MCACYILIRLAGSLRAVGVGPGSFLSLAAAPDSAEGCGSVCASPNGAAGSVNSPQLPKPVSAAGLKSCPTHGSPGEKIQE